jgi:hypothetical protein
MRSHRTAKLAALAEWLEGEVADYLAEVESTATQPA